MNKIIYMDRPRNGDFDWLSEKDKQKDWYNPEDYGDYLTLEEAKQLTEREGYMGPNGTRGRNKRLTEYMEQLKNVWGSVEIRFGGFDYEGHCSIDTVYIGYEQVKETKEFQEWMELKFCSWLGQAEFITEDHPRVEISHEQFRDPQSDEELWIQTDEIDRRTDQNWGKFYRIWWDD